MLNWQVPNYPNGAIQTYKILYTTDDTQKDNERQNLDTKGKICLQTRGHISVTSPAYNKKPAF